MKNLFMGALIVLTALAAAGLAQDKAPDITGEWELTTATPQGDMTMTVKFVQTGDKLVVTMTSDFGEANGEGTIKGNEVEWTFNIDTPNGTFSVFNKGKVDGDKMTGELQAGDFGPMTWTATKKAC